ncbi:Sugar transporter STL1 like protein [Verticillium longisporum]|nr:Sugar transporter STL1 like protein [Verticillium longisporum]
MGYTTWWKRLSPRQLNIAIQTFSVISIFFEGYDQGVMGGVNASPRYVEEVGIGLPDGTVTDTLHQGGIVSVYYLGCIAGCFAGGWLADRTGRINGLFIGCIFAIIGGALQAAAQSSNFIIVARVITGIDRHGRPHMHHPRHAYWLSFGLAFIDGGYSDIRWRFQLAFQCLPALLLFLGIKILPDTPRFLASVGRYDEAREVIEHVRGNFGPLVEREFLEIRTVAEESTKSSPIEFIKILFGRGPKPGYNLGQRAWLCLFLQIMASWTGITAVTAYSPILLSQAGYTELTQNGLAGGLNTVGIVGTIISAQIVDRLGRRTCLMGGALALSAVNLIAGALYEGSRAHPDRAAQFAPVAVAMLFLFNLSYAATWGTVAFLIPTEIWSSDLRAQGNGFGITGWAVGVGMTTLVNPIMFGVLENRTYFLFAGLNLLWVPVVFLFYPETSGRSLESIDALFAANSIFNTKMERSYMAHGDVLAERGNHDNQVLSASDSGSKPGPPGSVEKLQV